MGSRTLIPVLAAVAALPAAAPATAATTNPQIPGLQVALRAHGLYRGPIDGIAGPLTRQGVLAFQRKRGLAVDGIECQSGSSTYPLTDGGPRNGSYDVWLGQCKERDATSLG